MKLNKQLNQLIEKINLKQNYLENQKYFLISVLSGKIKFGSSGE